MSEQAQKLTDIEEMQALQNKLGLLAHKAGTLAYNITTYEQDIKDLQLEMKNTVVDINKLNAKLSKKEADDKLNQIAKDQPKAENMDSNGVVYELCPEQECSDVVQ